MELLRLGRSAWPTYELGSAKEWLETNGLGGWAYGTVPNVNTRFYHAVLAAAIRPPTERLVLLAKVEETLVIDGVRHPLSCAHWASGVVEDRGLAYLHSFALAPFPTWVYVVGEVTVRKRVFMRYGHNTTVIRYEVVRGAGRGTVRLELVPLVTCRTIHGVGHRNDWPFVQEQDGTAAVSVKAYIGAPRLFMAADGGTYAPDGAWVEDAFFAYELVRGEHTREDLYRPGLFAWDCQGSGEITFAASTDPLNPLDGADWEQAELERRMNLVERAGAREPVGQTLALAADQFVVQRGSTGTRTVIAGYPWFTDWGRDTMIALPGLTLTSRRYRLARELLQTFAAYERDGLIPNCFPEEGGEPLYNTADASLWFYEAAWQYLQHTSDDAFLREQIFPVLLRIARAHIEGTHFGIRVTENGLLRCGDPHVQVTWMDAKVGDWVVTPRDGRPVEIQALWYNALRILASMASRFGLAIEAERWNTAADRVRTAFDIFWNEAADCCYDLIRDDGTPDPAIRPNQLFTMTLSHPLLFEENARRVVDVVFRDLWTPYGLRSLSPRDPDYRGLYAGTRTERDGAYHQGTVWGWLMGPFLRAYLHAYGRTPRTLSRVRTLLTPMVGHLQEYGLGSIAENFDGDPPHHPRACVAQAWSVAEVFRIWMEE